MWEYLIYSYILIPIVYVLYLILKAPILKLFSSYYRQYYKSVDLYYEKRLKEAIKETKKAISMNPGDWKNYNNLGTIYSILGDNKKAIENFEKVIEIKKSKKTDAYASLAILYAEEGEDLSKCLELVKKAEEIGNKKLLNSFKEIAEKYFSIIYSWIYLRNGKKEEAFKSFDFAFKAIEQYLKKNRNLEGDLSNTIIFYHFGIILKHKGEYKKAIKYFKKSIKAGGPESIFSKRSEEEIRKIVNGEL